MNCRCVRFVKGNGQFVLMHSIFVQTQKFCTTDTTGFDNVIGKLENTVFEAVSANFKVPTGWGTWASMRPISGASK